MRRASRDREANDLPRRAHTRPVVGMSLKHAWNNSRSQYTCPCCPSPKVDSVKKVKRASFSNVPSQVRLVPVLDRNVEYIQTGKYREQNQKEKIKRRLFQKLAGCPLTKRVKDSQKYTGLPRRILMDTGASCHMIRKGKRNFDKKRIGKIEPLFIHTANGVIKVTEAVKFLKKEMYSKS